MIQQKIEPNFPQLVFAFENLLDGLGLDLESDHLKGTAERAAKAWYNELCSGITQGAPKITTFPYDGEPGMIVLHAIPVFSMCAHHLLPFIGKAVVGYIPGNGRVLGISKLSRIVNYCARRPQVQEELTRDIAQAMWGHIGQDVDGEHEEGAGGVGVVVRASHLCMELRGVNHPGMMETSELMGVFRESEVRAEFFAMAKSRME